MDKREAEYYAYKLRQGNPPSHLYEVVAVTEDGITRYKVTGRVAATQPPHLVIEYPADYIELIVRNIGQAVANTVLQNLLAPGSSRDAALAPLVGPKGEPLVIVQ